MEQLTFGLMLAAGAAFATAAVIAVAIFVDKR